MIMTFKELKSGYSVFLFDKRRVDINQGKIITVGIPHLDPHFTNSLEMFVDITVNVNDNIKSFTLKDNTEVGYTNDLVISTNKDIIIREVEALKAQSEEALSLIDTYKSNIEKCTNLLAEFNPAYKEKQETDKRFLKLESSISDMKKMLENLINSEK